jgi:predicted transposase/invertase (TIGR01784 family)
MLNNDKLKYDLCDPKVDVCFKSIFGNNKINFINLANAILNLSEGKKITSVEFLNLELERENIEDKESRVDVLAKLQDKSYIQIEMQYGKYKNFEQRILFYFSRVYTRQIKKGGFFSDLKPVIVINILNFLLFRDTKEFYSKLIISDAKSHIRRCKDFEMHFLELKKFNKSCYNNADKLSEWALFFKNPTRKTLEELAMQSPEIAKAYEELEIFSKDPKNRALYEARLKAIRDAEQRIYNSRREGEEKGRKEGKAAGIREMAQKMKSLGISIEIISESSGLSVEEIEKL